MQIAFALRQADSGTAVDEVVRKLGISEQTLYRRKEKFAAFANCICKVQRDEQ